jgi:hypothetical protein
MQTKIIGIVRGAPETAFAIDFPQLPEPVLLTAEKIDAAFKDRIKDALEAYFTDNKPSAIDIAENSIDIENQDNDLVGCLECELIQEEGGHWIANVGDLSAEP